MKNGGGQEFKINDPNYETSKNNLSVISIRKPLDLSDQTEHKSTSVKSEYNIINGMQIKREIQQAMQYSPYHLKYHSILRIPKSFHKRNGDFSNEIESSYKRLDLSSRTNENSMTPIKSKETPNTCERYARAIRKFYERKNRSFLIPNIDKIAIVPENPSDNSQNKSFISVCRKYKPKLDPISFKHNKSAFISETPITERKEKPHWPLRLPLLNKVPIKGKLAINEALNDLMKTPTTCATKELSELMRENSNEKQKMKKEHTPLIIDEINEFEMKKSENLESSPSYLYLKYD